MHEVIMQHEHDVIFHRLQSLTDALIMPKVSAKRHVKSARSREIQFRVFRQNTGIAPWSMRARGRSKLVKTHFDTPDGIST